jgi:hypothetical protein
MKEAKRNERHDAAIAELLGISLEEVQAQRVKEEKDSKAREAQAVLLFLEKPDKFITKMCTQCSRLFLTSYQFVSLCSSKCRIAALAEVGIDWNPIRTADERWRRAQIPVDYTIPPDAVEVLMQIAQMQLPSENDQDNPQSKIDPHTDLETWLDELDQPVAEANSEPSSDVL